MAVKQASFFSAGRPSWSRFFFVEGKGKERSNSLDKYVLCSSLLFNLLQSFLAHCSCKMTCWVFIRNHCADEIMRESSKDRQQAESISISGRTQKSQIFPLLETNLLALQRSFHTTECEDKVQNWLNDDQIPKFRTWKYIKSKFLSRMGFVSRAHNDIPISVDYYWVQRCASYDTAFSSFD